MSFPRAKIHRFNDIQSDAPSPTRYAPKSSEVAKGCAFGKGERERTMSSTSDTLSTGGTPFRTPFSVVKKHSCFASTDKLLAPRSMQFSDLGVQPCTDADEAALRGELAEKTNALNEYERLVDELKQRNKHIDNQNTELQNQIEALELAKADLECVVSNNQNCETQIKELTDRLKELQSQLDALRREKEELSEKMAEDEKNIVKLDEGNKEYAKRILNLEGALELVTSEYKEKVEEVKELKINAEKLKISIECLHGKISALENDVMQLEASKNKNEESIFGLEEQVSSLTFALEAARIEKQSYQDQVIDMKKACKVHEDTITGLDMQLECKQTEINKLNSEARDRIATLDSQINTLKNNFDDVTNREEIRNKELKDILEMKGDEMQNLQKDKENLEHSYSEQLMSLTSEKESLVKVFEEQLSAKEIIIKELEDERKRLLRLHDEEIFHMQNEWETKIFSQMQESEQAILEKEAVMKLAEFQHTKLLNEARAEFEMKLREAEAEASRRQSAQLEATEMIKAKYEARVAVLEADISAIMERNVKEALAETERQRAICEELEAHITNLKEENSTLSTCNHKTASRLNNMLEEIKILNSEYEIKSRELEGMTIKFNEEWKKNEMLSEQLGELDCKITNMVEELGRKRGEKDRLDHEVTKLKEENNILKMKNLDLQVCVATHEDTAQTLAAELNASRVSFNSQLVELSTELLTVKQQCRKFEIAMTDTRKSLEALGKRLIESENEVERMNQENQAIRCRLVAAENDKNDADNNLRKLIDAKIDLEQRIQSAESVEHMLRLKIKELELQNCDLELSKNELQILKETLEEDKKKYDEAVTNLRDIVNKQNLKMIDQEKSFLNQIEEVSQVLISRLDEFERFSTQKIQCLQEEKREVLSEKNSLSTAYLDKCQEFEDLFMDHDIIKTTFDIATKESQKMKHQYEEQKKELHYTVETLQAVQVEKRSISEKLETVNMASQNLAKELEDKVTMLEDLQADAKKHVSTISELRDEIAVKQACIDGLNNEITLLKTQFEQQLEAIICQHEKEKDLLIAEKKKYQSNILKNSDEIVALLLNLETESKKVETLEIENKKYSQKVQDLESNVLSLRTDIDERDKRSLEMVHDLENVKSHYNEAHEKNLSLENEHAEKIKCLEVNLKKAREDGEWKVKWEKLLEEKEVMSSELLAMTDKKDMYKHHCQRFEKQMADAQNERDTAVKDFNQIHELMQAKDVEIARLQKRVGDLESLIGPFREQLEEYENERLNLENDREQLRKQHLEQAAKLGHQNHKQKIQHVVRLKNDILELRKENTKLQTNIKNKNRIIENLREELGEHPKRLFVNGKRPTSTPFKGKENDERMSPIPNVKQEPMSPSIALKDRNY